MFIAPASRSLSHTLARKRASEAGARGATMPHVTTDMLARLMAIDFDRLKSRSHAVAELLDKGDGGEDRLPARDRPHASTSRAATASPTTAT